MLHRHAAHLPLEAKLEVVGDRLRFIDERPALSLAGEDAVLSLHLDRTGELWVGTDNPGVDRMRPAAVDAFGHPELGGLGQYLVDQIVAELGLKTRVDKAGTMQRSSGVCMSVVDAQEAAMAGREAVRQAVAAGVNVRTTFNPPENFILPLRELVQEGSLSIATLD